MSRLQRDVPHEWTDKDRHVGPDPRDVAPVWRVEDRRIGRDDRRPPVKVAP